MFSIILYTYIGLIVVFNLVGIPVVITYGALRAEQCVIGGDDE